jgi:hypothetical protein
VLFALDLVEPPRRSLGPVERLDEPLGPLGIRRYPE